MPLQVVQRLPVPAPPGTMTLAPPGVGVLPVPYVAQSEDNWCWAACGEMLFRHRGVDHLDQCGLASQEFDLVCCPSPGAPADCDQGCWPHDVYPDHGLGVRVLERSISPDEVREELDAGRPVQVLYQWEGSNSTHVALIVGETSNGKFQVFDPSPKTSGTGPRDFDYIERAYNKGTWIWTFLFDEEA